MTLCNHTWPDHNDALDRPHVCGLPAGHDGPHQAIGYHLSRYDEHGEWHPGGTTVLAEDDQ